MITTTSSDRTSRGRTVYHVALGDEWEAAREHGVYSISTRGRSLEEVGFIHCARAEQVEGVIERFYSDADDLVLLAIDVDRLDAEVVDEPAPGGTELFPHVYGPIPVAAVVDATAIDPAR